MLSSVAGPRLTEVLERPSVYYVVHGVYEGINAGDVARRRSDGAVGCIGEILDDNRICTATTKITRIAGQLIFGDFALQIAEANIDRHGRIRTHNGFSFKAIDVGADIVIHRSTRDDFAQLQVFIFIIKSGQVELQCTAKVIFQANFKRIHFF